MNNRPYHLENMELDELDALLVQRPDLHKEIAAAREVAECPHDELETWIEKSLSTSRGELPVYGMKKVYNV